MALNGYQHGIGDPNTLSPVPDGGASRFYIDDSTQKMYVAAQGSPTVWRDGGVVASYDATGLSANVSSTTLFTPTVTGMYEVYCYAVVTQAATTSSTLPAGVLQWTDPDANASTPTSSISATYTGNLAGGPNTGNGANTRVFRAKAGTAVLFSTTAYASSGATAMLYAVHVVVKHIG